MDVSTITNEARIGMNFQDEKTRRCNLFKLDSVCLQLIVEQVKSIPLMAGARTEDVILASGEVPKRSWYRCDSEVLLRASTWLEGQSLWISRLRKNKKDAPQIVMTLTTQRKATKLWSTPYLGSIFLLAVGQLAQLESQAPDKVFIPEPQGPHGTSKKLHFYSYWSALVTICEILHRGMIVWKQSDHFLIFVEHMVRLAEPIGVIHLLKHAISDLMLQADPHLFKSAQILPGKYLKLGFLLQNSAVFIEAAKPIISKWPCVDQSVIGEIMSPGPLRKFIEREYAKLVRRVDLVHLEISQLEAKSQTCAGKQDIEAVLATSLFRSNCSRLVKAACEKCQHNPGKGCTAGFPAFWHGFRAAEPRAYSQKEVKTSFMDSGMVASADPAKLAAYTKALTVAATKIVDKSGLLKSSLRTGPLTEVRQHLLTGFEIEHSDLPWLQPATLGKRKRNT